MQEENIYSRTPDFKGLSAVATVPGHQSKKTCCRWDIAAISTVAGKGQFYLQSTIQSTIHIVHLCDRQSMIHDVRATTHAQSRTESEPVMTVEQLYL